MVPTQLPQHKLALTYLENLNKHYTCNQPTDR